MQQNCLIKTVLSLLQQHFREAIGLYYSKKNMEPVQEEETSVWVCSNEDCSCWMRENLSFEENPTCPICNSIMEKNTKMLPPLINFNTK